MMKLRIFCTVSAMILCQALFTKHADAQDYKAIKTDAGYYFKCSVSEDVIAIRIDSIAQNGDETIYYNFRQLRQTDYGCWVTNGASWLGDLVIESPDGKTQFILYPFSPSDSNDVYTINTQAEMGDSWRFFNYHNGLQYVEATYTDLWIMDFGDLCDAVKIFTLQVKDASGQFVSSSVNGEEVILSANYGLIRMPKFDEFKDSPRFYFYCGKTNPELGYLNPTTTRIFDFQPGDEFHVVQYSESYNYGGIYSTASISRYLNRYDYPSGDSIIYTLEFCSLFYTRNNDGIENYSYSIDTLEQVVSPARTPQFELEPLEPILMPETGWRTYPYAGISGYPQNMPEGYAYKSFDPTMMWSDDGNGCLSPVSICGGCWAMNYYYKGLGGPYYHCDDPLYWGEEYRDLRFLRKGSYTWGTPLSCDSLMQVGITEMVKKSSLKIFPNPTSGNVSITVPYGTKLPAKLQIMDNCGRIVREFILNSPIEYLSLEDLPHGYYFYCLMPKSGSNFTGKIILH